MPNKRQLVEAELLKDAENNTHRNNEAIKAATGVSVNYIKIIRQQMLFTKQIPYRGEFVIASIIAQHEEGKRPADIARAVQKADAYVRRVIKRFAR